MGRSFLIGAIVRLPTLADPIRPAESNFVGIDVVEDGLHSFEKWEINHQCDEGIVGIDFQLVPGSFALGSLVRNQLRGVHSSDCCSFDRVFLSVKKRVNPQSSQIAG